jgi:hypothetical protein
MSFGLPVLAVFIGFSIGLWLLSHIVEALRPFPREPKTLRCAPQIPISTSCYGNGGMQRVWGADIPKR